MSVLTKKLKDEKGQSLTEFLIVLPIVLLLTFAILSFGFLLYDRVIVVLAASQAADKAGQIMYRDDLTLEEKEKEINDTAKVYLSYAMMNKDDDVDIFFDSDKVSVRVSITFTFLLPLLDDILGDTTEIPIKFVSTYMYI